MKKYLSYIVALTIILIGLSSCHTSAPRLDYKALAQASVRLGVDIELQDNHKLYKSPAATCVREIWCSSPAVLPAKKWHT